MVLQSTRWLALGYFTYFFSYGIFLPFWSVWLKGIGLTPETIGLLLGAGLVARFLGSLLIAPRVSDPFAGTCECADRHIRQCVAPRSQRH